jgi:acetylornithine deacetylase/succinyl-diaminopimelate desuccinylase-like protein
MTADEEGGASNGVDWLLKNRPELMKAEFVLNPDSGGVELRDGHATAMGVEATEKTYADFKLTTTNPGGHSSLPRPDNAIYELMHALEKLEANPFPIEVNPVTRAELSEQAKIAEPARAKLIAGVLAEPQDAKAVAEFVKAPTDNALLRTTCVATMLGGGHAPNALPAMATANVNCRILPGHSQEQTRQELIKLFDDPKLKVEYMADDGTISPVRLRAARVLHRRRLCLRFISGSASDRSNDTRFCNDDCVEQCSRNDICWIDLEFLRQDRS